MVFGKLSSKACAILLFIAGMLISVLAAYCVASNLGWTRSFVPVEKIADAAPAAWTYVRSVPLTAGIGTAVFVIGVILSFLAAELYYFVLEFLKKAKEVVDE